MHKTSVFSIIQAAFVVAICIIQADQIRAQELEFDEVQVIAPYEPSISDAFKLNLNPEIRDTMTVDIVFDYNISPKQIPVMFQVEPLNAARMKGEPLAKLYKGHVKAGLGSNSTPYAEVFYNTLRSKFHAYGAHVKHLSSSGGIDQYAHSGFIDNKINLFGKRFFRNHTLRADMNYTSNRVHYYGYKPSEFENDPILSDLVDSLTKKDIRQTFQFFSPTIGIKSNFLDEEKLHHDVELKYYYLADSYNSSEQRINLAGTMEKSLGEDPMGFAETQKFHLDLDLNYFYNQHEADTAHTGLVKIAPRLSSTYKDFDFYVGIDASLQADTASYMRFYPLAGAQVSLVENVLYAYASLSGGLHKHNLQQLRETNPFIQTSLAMPYMNVKSEIRGGFKGAISSFANYNIGVSNKNISNYPFFITDFNEPLENKFAILYDDVRVFNFRAEVFSNVGERLKLRFSADYFEYTPETENWAWHEPTVKLNLSAKYNIQDKIILTADAFARNSAYARIENPDGTIGREEIHGFHVDGNLGIEYRYTKILSIFLNLNNVQNQPLERWYNYPSQRFNVLGGVSYSF